MSPHVIRCLVPVYDEKLRTVHSLERVVVEETIGYLNRLSLSVTVIKLPVSQLIILPTNRPGGNKSPYLLIAQYPGSNWYDAVPNVIINIPVLIYQMKITPIQIQIPIIRLADVCKLTSGKAFWRAHWLEFFAY